MRTDTGHDADGEHVEGHHGTCKLAALRGGTDVARTHMATQSVLALCAVLERAAACLSDLPIAAKYKSYTGVHLTPFPAYCHPGGNRKIGHGVHVTDGSERLFWPNKSYPPPALGV